MDSKNGIRHPHVGPNGHVYNDVVWRIFLNLKNKNPAVRHAACLELREHVKQIPVELRFDPNSPLNSDLTPLMFDITHTPVPHEKLGGIAAIDQLIDLDMGGGDEAKRYYYRLYQLLRHNLPTNSAEVMAEASKALGRIVKIAGATFTDQFMEMETDRALALLNVNDRDEYGRYAAVCILRELAYNVPNLLYPFVPRILDQRIWVALRDSRLHVREGAADAMGACLQILYARQKQMGSQIFANIWTEANRGLTRKLPSPLPPETIHGSLLAVHQLLSYSRTFMRDHLAEACDAIIPLHQSRDVQIRNTVSLLIPQLAQYDPAFFEKRLNGVVLALIDQVRKDKGNREMWEQTFKAIGLLASAMGGKMKNHIEIIVSCLKEALVMRGKKNAPAERYMFECIGYLATAVGPHLSLYMQELLNLMFACSLSQELVDALERLVDAIGPLLRTVQERLLDKLSMVLIAEPYRPLGPPLRQGLVSRDVVAHGVAAESAETIVIALNTLGSFNFSGQMLSDFVRTCTLPYLEDDNVEVRKAAAISCAKRFSQDPICYQSSIHAIEVVNDVLDKLISVGIADPDPRLRYLVLQHLEGFDRHLAQAEYIRSLFIALNDEDFAVRGIATTIIGRLAKENPAWVMPSLRKALIQLLTELEYSSASRNKEEAAKLLTELLRSSQHLVKSYAIPMLHVLLPKAKDENPGVAACVIECLGELAKVGGEDLSGSVNDLLALSVDQLNANMGGVGNVAKRDASLRTLGLVVSNCGYEENPYLQYRSLLGNLIKILRTEQTASVRRETIRVMGVLGALDPYRYKLLDRSFGDSASEASKEDGSVDLFELAMTAGPTSNEYYQNVAVEALLGVLRDNTLTAHHYLAIEGVTYMFTTQGLKCVNFLKQIIPAFLNVIRTCPAANAESYYSKLTQLVGVIKQHIRNYLPQIFALIKDKWSATPNAQGPIVTLVQALARALEGEFKAFLPQLLPNMLQTLETDATSRRDPTMRRILDTFGVLGANLEEYLQLVLPAIIKVLENPEVPIKLRVAAVQTLGTLARRLNISDHASKVIQPLLRCLRTGPPELRSIIMDTLTIMGVQMGGAFVIFIPVINKITFQQRIQHGRYERLVAKVLNGERIPSDLAGPDPAMVAKAPEAPVADPQQMQVNQQHLKQAWDTSRVSTPDDWREWLRRMAVEFLRESPSHALRACRTLAENYQPIAFELFNAAFVSCFKRLYDNYRLDLIKSIEMALDVPDVPDQVVTTLLNLAEFTEHDSESLLIEIGVLGKCALKYGSHAKALHYKETEYLQRPSPDILVSLIDINTKLQNADAALGALNLAQDQHQMTLRQEWFEKLHRWEDALQAHEEHLHTRPDSWTANFGRMRCLHALGEWEQLAELVQERWHHPNVRTQHLSDMAPLAAAAAWSLGQWERMDEYIGAMRSESSERSFYRALGYVHRAQAEQAQKQIDRARDHLDAELSSAFNESYGRAYSLIVRTQMLSELEEALAYKTTYRDQRDRQASIRAIWMKRLDKCQPEVDVWQRILSVRSIVLTPEDDIDSWIKFANLCRKSGRMVLAQKTINSLLGSDVRNWDQPGEHAPPPVIYAHLKFSWAHGYKVESFKFLRQFTANLARDLGVGPREDGTAADDWNPPTVQQKDARLLARCYYKQADWQIALNEKWVTDDNCDVIWSFWRATQLDRNWYKAWHAWALANFEVISYQGRHGGAKQLMEASIVPAIEGFFRSIALAEGSSLQDTLRLLTLWFNFGDQVNVNEAVREGMRTISVDTWLGVIPQIVARFENPSERVRALIHVLMCELGKAHPQALVYALGVASKSPLPLRSKVADDIMQEIRKLFPDLVEQTEIVTKELIRVAILWNEMWNEALEEASRLYFTDLNVDGMFATLQPLHELLEKGAETLKEQSFAQLFGRDLTDAWELALRYKRYGEISDLNHAWNIYYDVFRRISKQMPASMSPQLDLQYCSPRLLEVRNLELAVPGTYEVGKPLVTIRQFEQNVIVLTSKQRPRRLKLLGSDGKTYQYLLKGHEDTRQDERVMQLFGLVNTLLSTDAECYKRRLDIRRYAIIPLSPNAGMIYWVEDTDTMHVLIKEYRDQEKILLNIEHRLMLQMAPDYEHLTLLQKVEVFQYALDNTTGQDLYRMMWLRSRNSEIWLQRRTTYTRSIATASMTGYILGLGDRHPSNLLFHRLTGQIVNIDFGDCFEFAALRPKYPERVPFRLTRMLVTAMEVGGLKGTFKITSEHVMRVLRDNKESVLALLEAFVHDPLITWKLLTIDVKQPRGAGEKSKYVTAATGERNAQHRDEGHHANRAVQIMQRIESKLKGRDFNPEEVLKVPDQVERLVQEATSLFNLAPAFLGWCSFW
ncbi:phosphatidylinositol kinase- protein kinase tor1 [Tilletia horrida]|uniref:non-specific serine/threonine protein kinase n=1 Tax=Tilletia horrida TaxID=155126 RepID=A0AAN6GGA5_9BASI|nr:phosphatidylinositol kinase- protein kinase tor1 [Tilletia horrida]